MSGYNKNPRKNARNTNPDAKPITGSGSGGRITGTLGSSSGSGLFSSRSKNPYLDGVIDPVDSNALVGASAGSRITALDLQNLNSKNNGFDEILARFAGNSDISSLLNALGVGNNKTLSDTAAEDWNKQLLETLLNYQLEREKRNYNESLRDEQRIYDTPTNQLARLMGAGISRDAAIQMLSGSGGSGGANVPYGDAAAAAQGVPASQSDLNETQRKTAIANAVFSGIDTLANLCSLGIGIPQGIQQIKMMQAQAYLSEQNMQGYQSAQSVYNALQNGLSLGSLAADTVASWSNLDDMSKWFSENRDTDFVRPLYDSGALDSAFGTLAGRKFMNENWQQMRKSRNDGEILDAFIRQQHLNNDLTEVNVRKGFEEINQIIAEVSKTDAEVANLMQDFIKGNIEIEILNSDKEWRPLINEATYNDIRQSAYLKHAQAYLTNEQGIAQEVQNDIMSDAIPFLSAAYCDKAEAEFTKWRMLTQNRGALEQYAQAWVVENSENAKLAAFCDMLYKNAEYNAIKGRTGILGLCRALKECGVTDYLRYKLDDRQTESLIKFREIMGNVAEQNAVTNALDLVTPW